MANRDGRRSGPRNPLGPQRSGGPSADNYFERSGARGAARKHRRGEHGGENSWTRRLQRDGAAHRSSPKSKERLVGRAEGDVAIAIVSREAERPRKVHERCRSRPLETRHFQRGGGARRDIAISSSAPAREKSARKRRPMCASALPIRSVQASRFRAAERTRRSAGICPPTPHRTRAPARGLACSTANSKVSFECPAKRPHLCRCGQRSAARPQRQASAHADSARPDMLG